MIPIIWQRISFVSISLPQFMLINTFLLLLLVILFPFHSACHHLFQTHAVCLFIGVQIISRGKEEKLQIFAGHEYRVTKDTRHSSFRMHYNAFPSRHTKEPAANKQRCKKVENQKRQQNRNQCFFPDKTDTRETQEPQEARTRRTGVQRFMTSCQTRA